MSDSGINQFVRVSRVQFEYAKELLRVIHVSEVIKQVNKNKIVDYIADKAPLFYRNPDKIAESFGDGFFLTAIKETLAKLPTAENFQSSHFGEIAACIFAEEVIGLKKIYSKLSLNTSENQNALKMDLLFYKPNTSPIEFYFGEVKSSPKDAEDGLPADHHLSCYSSLFNSLRTYTDEDLAFDLAAIKDNLDNLPSKDREEIRKALMPYAPSKKINFIGFAIIDLSTKNETEIPVLGTRKNPKHFEVDLICLESYKEISKEVFNKFKKLKDIL